MGLHPQPTVATQPFARTGVLVVLDARLPRGGCTPAHLRDGPGSGAETAEGVLTSGLLARRRVGGRMVGADQGLVGDLGAVAKSVSNRDHQICLLGVAN